MEEIFGYVDSIVFSAETFTVARLKEPRKQELTCIVGPLPSVQPGETIRCSGKWKYHSQYGQQFEVESFESKQPSDLVGIQKYLESGMIKGIGPVYAEKIIKQFGINTLKIIDDDPERLGEVSGIGPKRLDMIKSCWDQQKSIREVMLFLQTFGVSPAFAHKIYKTYGKECVEKIKNDPYVLAKDIRGIGFKYADQIALKMGLPLHSLTRIQAGIEHVLWELSSDGHTCYPSQDLITAATEILTIPPEEIQNGLEESIQSKQLISYEGMISLKPFHLAEKGIVREMKRLLSNPCELRSVNHEKAILWSEEKLNITFAEEQKLAIIAAVKDKVHIITGGPGTGKSTITKAILRITEKLTDSILLAAPTGRAAKRMSEITGKKASTIHGLLEMDFQSGGFKRGLDNPLKCDLLIIDEASMIDTFLLFQLLKAIPSMARVVLIGDIDQLPSVGAGTVLRDLIDSNCIEVTKLTQIFRQAAHSKIVTNAHLINQGKFPELFNTFDFRFIEGESPELIVSAIKDLISGPKSLRSRFHIFEDVQVLSPMKRGLIGTENLNVVLQGVLNPSVTPLCRMGRTFHVGDKVMQIRNDYEKLIFNGDIGRILTIDLSTQVLSINFDGRRVEYQFAEIDDLVLAYAVSIHKYQGSECPCIIIPVHMSHFKMLHRNLLYTGITRGKKMVILIGTKQAIGLAVRNDDVKKRYTQLKEQFAGTFSDFTLSSSPS
ncbi:ATP-dependent RecD-like DNA helicase [Rhabdochlamydiaceae symbiont of Dictyostelium giganteum]|uniref:SF1B family DNA helicase RecD2 n=1 Tax=Rhabdochlamydiaceae symbiont of Dictyostelium giganteum TaxID=3342349 RepID=UPI00384FAE00